mmetsp:Transcript_20119/g.37402  ORF Transcript_20119/g.37402 Transcript_20119/m.37402 type:complete len:97 (-) Transcript_20119:2435-2725(-)
MKYLPLLKVNEALTTDLQDPRLAQYRRRLFTSMPEAFNVRYLQDTDLRRFDGTLPDTTVQPFELEQPYPRRPPTYRDLLQRALRANTQVLKKIRGH